MTNIIDITKFMPIIHTEAFSDIERSDLAELAGQGNPLPCYVHKPLIACDDDDTIMFDCVKRYLLLIEETQRIIKEMQRLERIMKAELDIEG